MEAQELTKPIIESERVGQLHALARQYVLEGLGNKNFDAIPYANAVCLRAPLCPGGTANPITGKENLRNIWWAPLPDLLGEVKMLDSFVNQDLSAVCVEFHCQILLNPPVELRVMDRFQVNAEGKITDQENFFDPRDVTNPGWR
ncbi:nuclear transport factor 2 family protein [Adhaeribacter radiodurans]|uniref:Nuclear transport factor 2 family protein n=1 Tax=Adhaeribacter radiodurans TaxID=2745197 RepID=A0A7L7L4R0_9BACT|nr:hypothetical protein [Adhaeribacter radiodurans]QMU27753.1 hypothetical protein HUW48_06710 [Adhaeribacter radiodurans]